MFASILFSSDSSFKLANPTYLSSPTAFSKYLLNNSIEFSSVWGNVSQVGRISLETSYQPSTMVYQQYSGSFILHISGFDSLSIYPLMPLDH